MRPSFFDLFEHVGLPWTDDGLCPRLPLGGDRPLLRTLSGESARPFSRLGLHRVWISQVAMIARLGASPASLLLQPPSLNQILLSQQKPDISPLLTSSLALILWLYLAPLDSSSWRRLRLVQRNLTPAGGALDILLDPSPQAGQVEDVTTS